MNLQEAAASMLVPAEETAPAAQPPIEGAAPLEGAPIEQEEPGLDDLIDELAAEDGDEGEGNEPEANVPPPPHSWSKDDAEAWKGLTPEAREVVQRRETERDKFVAETGRRAADARKAVERDAMEAVAARADQYAQQLDAVLQHYLPQPPDQRLLYSQDPNDVINYQRQSAFYQQAIAQHQTVQQQAEQARAQALTARTEVQQARLNEEAQRLAEQLPEWTDPSARGKLLTDLQSVGTELGYPNELMAEAGATDILALKKAAEWRDKARKYDRAVGKRMETVRAAKGLPKITRPGAVTTRTPQDNAEDFQARIRTFNEQRSPEAAAALLLVRK